MSNISITLYEFAWTTLTSDQKLRVEMKYDLVQQLNTNKGCKRDVYRAIAGKYGYTMERVEYIANHELKKIDYER